MSIKPAGIARVIRVCRLVADAIAFIIDQMATHVCPERNRNRVEMTNNHHTRTLDSHSLRSRLIYAAGRSPKRYCPQFKLPSGIAHRRLPTSDPAAPAATWMGKMCSKLGWAARASGRFSSADMAVWRPLGSAMASATPSSKLEA